MAGDPVLAAASLLFLLAPVPPQSPAGEHPSLGRAREAIAEGRHAEAWQHLRFALEAGEEPAVVAALGLQNAAAAGDDDARILWAVDLLASLADERGVADVPAGAARAWPEDLGGVLRDVARTRARAVAALERLAGRRRKGRQPGSALVAEWAEDLARLLAAPSPILRWKVRDLDPAIAADPGPQRATIQALQRLASSSLAAGDPATAVRAARILQGLAAQARFKDLQGPPPPSGVEAAARAASQALGQARSRLAGHVRVYSLEELEAMTWDEQRAFTLEHADFGNPGVALSPRGWYRVETTCGWETLLGAASTVELHHERLARWYGQDPFRDRPGILRVVPESYGLEMEGAPFWWVGGFQGGDVTTLKFTMGTIPGLGRGITHELTHRFDGAVFGGLPAWLAEGRAVWTAAAYGSMHDMEFVDNHCLFGTIVQTRNLGYAATDKLAELVSGTIEEYRDNYVAGYALWVFLRSWTGPEDDAAPPRYRDRLEGFMRDPRRRKGDPLEVFLAWFADGRDGRPDGLEAFADDWRTFLAGFDWKEPAPFTSRYTQQTPPGDPAEVVLDEPTWTWLRRRAEPWFGEQQARCAGELLAEQGREREAVDALTWSLATDEPAIATMELLARLCASNHGQDAAWVCRHWPRFEHPAIREASPEPCPFEKDLKAVTEHLEALARATQRVHRQDALQAAAALAADHDRLAHILGLPPLDLALPPPDPASLLHPFDALPFRLGARGWGEEGLTGHEDRRVPGLWGEDPNLDLHVGRRGPSSTTGDLDRRSLWRDAFVLGKEWLVPGRYVLRTRIQATTAFVSGGVVVGWTRRDRNFRFHFRMGDWNYAVGETQEREALDGVSWSLDGLYTRQPPLRGSVGFGRERNHFALEVEVDGPTVEVRVDGRTVAVMSAVDGRPVQGRIGFYTGMGAFRAAMPVVQRLDRSSFAGNRAWGGGLDPRRRGAQRWPELVGRPVTGLPLHPRGTILLWFPEQPPARVADSGIAAWTERVQDDLGRILDLLEPEEPSEGCTVVLPAALPEELLTPYRERLEALFPERFAIARHHHDGWIEENQRTVGGWARTWVGFVDPAGILRLAVPATRLRVRVPEELRRLMVVHQGIRRPGLAGARE